MNGYNFTERVRKVLAMSREEAARLHHEYVGTEHLLLGLLREGEGCGATVLLNLSVELDELSDAIDGVVKAGSSKAVIGPDLPYTSRAKKVLELAMSSARELNHSYVGTEHLLLGLIREEKGIAAQLLAHFGVNEANARDVLLEILGTATPAQRTAPPALSRAPQYAERLRTVIAAAHDVAAKRKSPQVTPAHTMIALLEHGHGMANTALDSLSLNRADALAALNRLAPEGTTAVGPEDVLTPNAELARVLGALETKTNVGKFTFGTQHLLMILLQTSPDVAAVLESQNIPYHAVRDTITRMTG